MTVSMLRSILFSVGAIMFLGSLIAGYIVINGFITYPTYPDPAAGQTIPYEIKGKTVYITENEKRATMAIFVGGISGLVLLVSYGALIMWRKT